MGEGRMARTLVVVLAALSAAASGGCGARAHTKLPAVIGRGTTLAGTSFVATVSRGEQQPPTWLAGGKHVPADRCPVQLQIEGPHSGGYATCLSGVGSEADESITCSSGILQVTSFTLPPTRRVRLSLSDGRQAISTPLRAPADLGRSAGLYYQLVRGPSPIPVSLTELDANGHTLRVTHLFPVIECTKEPLKYLSGGVRTLVKGRVPGGPRFSIKAERYRFLGKVYFNLAAETEQHGEEGGGGGSFAPEGRRILEWTTQEGCSARHVEWTIVYGLLRNARYTAAARIGRRTYPLRPASIPASFHAGGVLAYVGFARKPTEVFVRSPTGAIKQDDKLGALNVPCEPGSSRSAIAVGSG